jgi:type I restriction enzyme, S subunit
MKLLDSQLPAGWSWESISARYRVTKKPKGRSYLDFDTIPFVSMEAVPVNGREPVRFELRKPTEIASGTYFEKGDVLLSKITPSFENGKQGLANNIPTPFGVASTEIIPLQATSAQSDNRFLFFYLLHPEVRAALTGQMEGSTGRQRVPEHTVRDFSVPMPPKPEQEKIAAVLWKVQRSIEMEEKLTATGRELKQSAMRQLFKHGVRAEPGNETDIGYHPKSWKISALSEVAKLERGRFLHRPRNEPRFYGGNTPFVQTGDVVRSRGWIRNYTQTLNEEGVAISRVFSKNTILITIAANIGFTGVLDFDSACPDSLIGITPNEQLDTWYLEYFLQTQQADMDRLAPKGTQKNINIQFLSPWPIAFPSLAEQRQIASILKTIDGKIEVHERKREAAKQLFNTLLHQLMTGEVRVANLDIDVGGIQS